MRNAALLLFLLPLLACAGQAQQAPTGASKDFQPDGRPMARTLVYECQGDVEFITRVGPGEMALWFEDRYLVLPQVRSGSGTRYEEADVVFWSKGEEAMLEVAGRSYRDCRLNPARAPWEDARRRGIDFRAIGNEPGWSLEIRGNESLLFVGDYGASKFLFNVLTRTGGSEQVLYEARQGDDYINVTVEENACADSMSGERSPFTVVVQLNDRRYPGCGRKLDHPWVR